MKIWKNYKKRHIVIKEKNLNFLFLTSLFHELEPNKKSRFKRRARI